MYRCNVCNNEKEASLFVKGRKSRCKDCANAYAKKYREDNKETIKQKQKDWYDNSGTTWKKEYDSNRLEANNTRDKIKYHNNPSYRLKCILRTRLYKTMKGIKNSKSIQVYLGMTSSNFVQWIQYQFDGTGFTWNNYGKEWEIDHVIPCSSLDLTKEEAKHECFHWSNMRPLLKIQNMEKSNKICKREIEEHQEIVERYKSLLTSTKGVSKGTPGVE